VAGWYSGPRPMDFPAVFDEVASFLEGSGHPVAVVGGLGLHAYGLSRATFDLDLLTEASAQPALVAFLERSGYEALHVSAGYSNHVHRSASRGRIDVVYVDPATAERVFRDARARLALGPRQALVPRPEHLAAMKVRAMKNDPTRTLQDMADIQGLLRLPETDREEVRSYFERAGLSDKYDEILRSL